MFKRRNPLSLFCKIREVIWPASGWMRAFTYLKHRILRQNDSSYKVAAGLAIGGAVSFSPIVGTHFMQAIFLAWIFRANYVSSLVGTAIGNPWTFPLLFWLAYSAGIFVLGLFGFDKNIALPEPLTPQIIFANPEPILLPMMVGGYLCALIYGVGGYFIFHPLVTRVQNRYTARRFRRIRRKLKKKDIDPAGDPGI